MGCPPDPDQEWLEGVIIGLLFVAIMWTVVKCFQWALAEPVQAAPTAIVACPAPPPPEEACPGWLFGTDLEKAKDRICRRPR